MPRWPRSWWLSTQPTAVRRYFSSCLALAAVLTSGVVVRSLGSGFSVVGVATFCLLAVGVSLATRPVLAAFPGTPAIEDPSGAWMLAALLIWGPLEALVIAVLIGGIWAQFFDRRWAGGHRETAKSVFNVAATFVGIDVARLVIQGLGPQPHLLGQLAGMVGYLVSSTLLVLGVLRLSGSGNPLLTFRSWSQRVLLLTEIPLGVGIAVAWRSDPVAGILLSVTLIAAGAGLHAAHLLEEASTDRRTGLLRPDAWTGTVVRLLSRKGIGLILADVDHFKLVNDRYGHLAGDEVLSGIGSVLAQTLRPGDVAGRWGGEEFVVALPDVSPGELREIAERIAGTVRSTPDVSDGRQIGCTVSVGIAYVDGSRPRDAAAAVRQALGEADRAMYAAKRAGRDRVVAHSDLDRNAPRRP